MPTGSSAGAGAGQAASQRPASQTVEDSKMMWSTHIDTGVEILKRDPETRDAAAATYFCSAGHPPIGQASSARRLGDGFSFVCAFHYHELATGANHWTMSWVDVASNEAVHYDSLWDVANKADLAESLQKLRLERHNRAKRSMETWLSGSPADFHRPGAPDWLYQVGRKTMQKDSWSCGLQMLEVLRVILQAGGNMDEVRDLFAGDHTLDEGKRQAWIERFKMYEGGGERTP